MRLVRMTADRDIEATADGGVYLDAVVWDERGLAPVVAQDADTGQVLMLAWMNRDALAASVDSGYATYWSRSRARIWRKGETSGHVQRIVEVRLDCDNDSILLRVEQSGGIACHTGRAACFYKVLETTDRGGRDWVPRDPVLKDPDAIY